MKGRHFTHRADKNHWQIKHDLERAGFIVIDIHHGNLADLLVLAYGRWFVVEIKAKGKIKQLTKSQEEAKALMGKYVVYGETSLRIMEDIWEMAK
jgi:hypothetical protein